LAKFLELHKGSKQWLKEVSKLQPLILDNPRAKLVQGYKRKHHGIVTDNEKDQVKDWLFGTTCTLVSSASPNQRDEIIVGKCPVTGEPVKERMYLYQFCKRNEVYMDFIKHEDDGGYPGALDAEGNPRIGFTTFEKLLPINFKRMTKSYKQMCGCVCLDTRWMHTGLKEFRTERIRHLDYLVGKYTNDPTMPPERMAKLERKLADYQSKVWPNGHDQEQVHPTAKDAMLSLTCPTIGTMDFAPY
jgi:hypothetical protein